MILLCFCYYVFTMLFCIVSCEPEFGRNCQECCSDRLNLCGRNATYKSSPINPCPRTCSSPDGVTKCLGLYVRKGCECNPGYVLSEDDGRCILLKDCPDYLRCGGDRNATYKNCPSPCPLTCKFPGGTGVCSKMCKMEGCECKAGYYLGENGKCVQFQDCPRAKTCKQNENFVFCNAGCPNNFCSVDDNRAVVACSPPFPCMSGCACKENHLRRSPEDDTCIPAAMCPPVNCTRPNEVRDSCPPPCLRERCADMETASRCDRRFFPCRPQCVCKTGFLRNDSDICVPEKNCTPTIPTCDREQNEILSSCKIVCPPQTCESIYTLYLCIQNIPCEWGCDCVPGYLRNSSGACVPSEKCPRFPPLFCEENETPSDCRVICPPQTCDSIFTDYNCGANDVCEHGCDCLDGYLRNDRGVCIPSEQCFSEPKCNIPIECRPTCAVPNPAGCPSYTPSETNQDGCSCKQGFILSEAGGKCIEVENCPSDSGCNGDPKATVRQCPQPCPSTCASPDNAMLCKRQCDPIGCQCLPGYILSEANGKCILPEECKHGNPCGPNGTFVPCKTNCPSLFCPIDDSRGTVICDPPPIQFCQSGCICQFNHRMTPDRRCIRSDECPMVNCTRRNEHWNSCPIECNSGYCEEVNNPPSVCNTLVQNCNPQCTCNETYFRDPSTDMCVSTKECRKINKNKHQWLDG